MTTYRVEIIESERGWGRSTVSNEYFTGKNALEKAKAFQTKYNSKNPPGLAPDWYMQAEDPFLVPDEEAPKKPRAKKVKSLGRSPLTGRPVLKSASTGASISVGKVRKALRSVGRKS